MQPAETTRYKQQLAEIQSRLTDELRRLPEAVAEDVQAPGDLSDVPTHLADRDSEGVRAKIAWKNSAARTLERVNEAIARFNAGGFGVCANCGAEISRERLDAIPYAPYCVRCEAEREQQSTTS